jgi:hypothetical protein
VAVVGFAGWGLASRSGGGKGLPGAAAAAEFASYAVIASGLVVLGLQVRRPGLASERGRPAALRPQLARLMRRPQRPPAVQRAPLLPATPHPTRPPATTHSAPHPPHPRRPARQVAHYGYIPGALPDDKCYGAGASPISSVGDLPKAAQALVSLLQKVSSVGRFVDVLQSS